jgi:hypothetical protein
VTTHVVIAGGAAPVHEIVAQTLAAGGINTLHAEDLGRAEELASEQPVLVLLLARELAGGNTRHQIPLAPGGCVILFRSNADVEAPPLDHALGRIVLAELTLPLERTRLLALVARIIDRARTTGRDNPRSEPNASP